MEISCVIIGRNEYPTFTEAIERLDKELQNIEHEIIFVNIASTDGTKEWLDTFAEQKGVIRIDYSENMGVGHALNRGMSKAKGKYIFHIAGDILPTMGSVVGLKEYIDEHERIDYLAVSAITCQDKEKDPPFKTYAAPMPIRGLGDFAYGYSIFRREIWDAGCRYPETGPFKGPGGGFEDAEFASQMYAQGFRCWMFNHPEYYHAPHNYLDKKGATHQEVRTKFKERKLWLNTRWNEIKFNWTHYNEQPPERHIRRIAVIYRKDKTTEQTLAPGDYIVQTLKDVCHIEHFQPGEEIDGFDNYIYIRDNQP